MAERRGARHALLALLSFVVLACALIGYDPIPSSPSDGAAGKAPEPDGGSQDRLDGGEVASMQEAGSDEAGAEVVPDAEPKPSPCLNADAPCGDGGGNLCPLGTFCDAGTCVQDAGGGCEGLDEPCVVGTCDAATGSCLAEPAPDGTPCDDGYFCTTGDTCVGGQCAAGPAMDCSDLDATCIRGVCDEAADACVADAAALDGQACGFGRTCVAGTCAIARDCAGADSCSLSCGSATCTVDCTGANHCGGECTDGAQCAVGCRDANDCEVDCASSATCSYDCTGANNCDQIDCTDGASCVIDCTGTNNCSFHSCWTDAVLCPDGHTLHCGGACP